MKEPQHLIQQAPAHLLIRPAKGWVSLNLKDLWTYRELLYFLTWRDVKVRYKQTILGIAWAVIQPLMVMIVFTIFFGTLAKVPSDNLPYPVFTFCALLPWTLFARALGESSNSLVANSNLISKVYFPRLVIPISAIMAGFIDFIIAFVILLAMMAWYGIIPSPAILSLPFFILLAVATALAASLWLSALNVEYRDVRYTLPFLTQIWMFASPIAYPSSLVPEQWRTLYGLNPMAGVIEGFRWALLGKSAPDWGLLTASVMIVLILLITGLVYFKRMERTFADVI
jgi:lipopolysaccharide transport system permease protein